MLPDSFGVAVKLGVAPGSTVAGTTLAKQFRCGSVTWICWPGSTMLSWSGLDTCTSWNCLGTGAGAGEFGSAGAGVTNVFSCSGTAGTGAAQSLRCAAVVARDHFS